MSWPAEIDVFLAVGELALYVAYLDAWPARQRIWPWATALTGLAVSVAGNVGHIQAVPGDPVTVADRVTAATSPLAAFAGLSVGLLVVKMTRQHSARRPPAATLMLAPPLPPPCCRCDHRATDRICGHRAGSSPAPRRDPHFPERHPPAASGSASALWPGSSVATGTISPTITCARSRETIGLARNVAA